MSVSGGFASLAKFSQDLRKLPRAVAQKVASAAAPAITELATKAFDNSETPYGVPWEPKEDGQKATLKKSGALARYIKYVAIGTKLRVALGVPYAKYQIGKRPIFPRQGGDLPPEYVETLQRVAVEVVRSELGT